MPRPTDAGDLDLAMDVTVDGIRQASTRPAFRRPAAWVFGIVILVAAAVTVLVRAPAATPRVDVAMVTGEDTETLPLPHMPTAPVAQRWSVDLDEGERIDQVTVADDTIVAVVIGQTPAESSLRAWDAATGRPRWQLEAVVDGAGLAAPDGARLLVQADDRVISFTHRRGGSRVHRVVRIEDGTVTWTSPDQGFLRVHPWRPEIVFVPFLSTPDPSRGVTGVLVDLALGVEHDVPIVTVPWRAGWVSLQDVTDSTWAVRDGDQVVATVTSDDVPARLGGGWLTLQGEDLVAVDADGSGRWRVDRPAHRGRTRLLGLDVVAVVEGVDDASQRDSLMHLVDPFGRVRESPDLDPWLVLQYGLVAAPALPDDSPVVQVCTGADTINASRPCPGAVEVRTLDGAVLARRAVSPLQRFEGTTEPVTLTAEGVALLTREGMLGLAWTTLDTLWRIDREGLRREPQVTRLATSADGVAVSAVGDDPGAPNFLAWYAPTG